MENKTPKTGPAGARAKIAIVVLLLAAIAVAFALKKKPTEHISEMTPPVETTNAEVNGNIQKMDLPRLLDLGSDQCIPCKMMVPVLKELSEEYSGRMKVDNPYQRNKD